MRQDGGQNRILSRHDTDPHVRPLRLAQFQRRSSLLLLLQETRDRISQHRLHFSASEYGKFVSVLHRLMNVR
jgi:hypothetical protein